MSNVGGGGPIGAEAEIKGGWPGGARRAAASGTSPPIRDDAGLGRLPLARTSRHGNRPILLVLLGRHPISGQRDDPGPVERCRPSGLHVFIYCS